MEYPPNLHALRPCLEQMKSMETLDDRIPIGKKKSYGAISNKGTRILRFL
jgi:hypothetical protein